MNNLPNYCESYDTIPQDQGNGGRSGTQRRLKQALDSEVPNAPTVTFDFSVSAFMTIVEYLEMAL